MARYSSPFHIRCHPGQRGDRKTYAKKCDAVYGALLCHYTSENLTACQKTFSWLATFSGRWLDVGKRKENFRDYG